MLVFDKKYLAASVIDIATTAAEPAAASSWLYHSLYRLQRTHGIVVVAADVVDVVDVVVSYFAKFIYRFTRKEK